MVRLELSNPQAEVLQTALESYLSDLRMEIADTDSMDYRDRLKLRKNLLSQIVERLERLARAS